LFTYLCNVTFLHYLFTEHYEFFSLHNHAGDGDEEEEEEEDDDDDDDSFQFVPGILRL